MGGAGLPRHVPGERQFRGYARRGSWWLRWAGRSGRSHAARSAGRFPDGADTGNNGNDYLSQTVITLTAEVAASANNIKVASVADLAAGQTIIIDTGANRETAVKIGRASHRECHFFA